MKYVVVSNNGECGSFYFDGRLTPRINDRHAGLDWQFPGLEGKGRSFFHKLGYFSFPFEIEFSGDETIFPTPLRWFLKSEIAGFPGSTISIHPGSPALNSGDAMFDKITVMGSDGSINYFDSWDKLCAALKRVIADETISKAIRYEAIAYLDDIEMQLKEFGQ